MLFDVYQHVPHRQKAAVVKMLPALVGKGKMVVFEGMQKVSRRILPFRT